jgi:cytochrome c biogenesis protein CcdA
VLLFLGLGLLLGVRHALEADHLAAVVALSTRTRSRVEAALRGAAWGLGHSTSLLVVGAICLALGTTLSPAHARWLERGVGVMLIVLGVNVLRRVRRGRLHVHVHRHDGGVVHVHAHRHAPDERHASSAHDHAHPSRTHWRALAVGTVHGMAGSAALVVLASASAGTFWLGVGYIAVFGLGSIIGMAALSVVISLPLEFSASRLAHAYGVIEVPIALATMSLGAWMLR